MSDLNALSAKAMPGVWVHDQIYGHGSAYLVADRIKVGDAIVVEDVGSGYDAAFIVALANAYRANAFVPHADLAGAVERERAKFAAMFRKQAAYQWLPGSGVPELLNSLAAAIEYTDGILTPEGASPDRGPIEQLAFTLFMDADARTIAGRHDADSFDYDDHIAEYWEAIALAACRATGLVPAPVQSGAA